jgi:hypothetical protein
VLQVATVVPPVQVGEIREGEITVILETFSVVDLAIGLSLVRKEVVTMIPVRLQSVFAGEVDEVGEVEPVPIQALQSK